MKHIFDWLREQIGIWWREPEHLHENHNFYNGLECAIRIITEAEAKWETDCCEWKDTKIGIFPIKTNCGNWIETNYGYKFCPYCGKPIKIVEVE